MKYLIILLLFFITITFTFKGLNTNQDSLEYIGQKPPGLIPKVFAPSIISKKNEHEFGSVFNKKGTEFFYGVDINGKSEIRYTQLKGKTWCSPKVLISHSKFSFNDPFLSPDESKLYFISDKSNIKNSSKDFDIFYIKRIGNKWNTEKIYSDKAINSNRNEYYVSFTNDGKLYFSSNRTSVKNKPSDYNIYSSELKNGEFLEPKLLNNSINSLSYEADVFVAPDESYLIFCSIRKEGFGKGDLYISFKDSFGKWSQPINMGKAINTQEHELCPFVTKDGKYFFYTSNQNIYWVDSAILNTFKN